MMNRVRRIYRLTKRHKVLREWARKYSRQLNTADDSDTRGYKYDAEVNINQLLDTNYRNVFGSSDLDGFRAKGFNSFEPTSSPEVAKQVFDFFKSRKSPEEQIDSNQPQPNQPRFKSLKDVLSKPKEAIRRTKEHVSSMMRRRTAAGDDKGQLKLPPKPAQSAKQRQAEIGAAKNQTLSQTLQQQQLQHKNQPMQHLDNPIFPSPVAQTRVARVSKGKEQQQPPPLPSQPLQQQTEQKQSVPTGKGSGKPAPTQPRAFKQ